jgi:hypothetical protein
MTNGQMIGLFVVVLLIIVGAVFGYLYMNKMGPFTPVVPVITPTITITPTIDAPPPTPTGAPLPNTSFPMYVDNSVIPKPPTPSPTSPPTLYVPPPTLYVPPPTSYVTPPPTLYVPPPTLYVPPPPKATTTFWMKGPGGGYVNGLPYSGAASYCTSNGGTLASIAELQSARTKGFEACAYGWTRDSKAAYVMQKDGVGGCNTVNGININPNASLTTKYGVYCIKSNGSAPTSSDIVSVTY